MTMIDEGRAISGEVREAGEGQDELSAELKLLTAERDAAELREALRNRTAELNRLENEFDTFKERVRDIAIEKAGRYGWCGVVDDALEEMGLERRTQDYEVTVTITGLITTRVEARDEDDAVESALEQISISTDNHYTLHGEEFHVTYVESRADEV